MLKTAHELVAAARATTKEISLEDAVTLFATAPPLILDVREPGEFANGHLPGAVNVPRGLLEFSLNANPDWDDPELTALLYCKNSGRAALAAQAMQTMGYSKISSLAGGFDAWIAAGLPVDQPPVLGFD